MGSVASSAGVADLGGERSQRSLWQKIAGAGQEEEQLRYLRALRIELSAQHRTLSLLQEIDLARKLK